MISTIKAIPPYSGTASAAPSRRQAPVGAAAQPVPTDTVSISPMARLAAGTPAMGSVFGVKPRADGAIHLEDIERQFQENTKALHGELQALLRDNGLDAAASFELTTNEQGRLQVGGNHPDKDEIQSLLDKDDTLSRRIQETSGMAAFLRVAEKHGEFAHAYADNPQAAVAKYSHLFGASGDPASLRYGAGGLSAVFADSGRTAG